MEFVSIRIITGDVARLVAFYEKATGVQANWSNEDFAELRTTRATLAIGGTRTVPLFAPGAARPADNHTVIIEFLVDDVDGVHQNLAGFVEDFVNEPTTMPWGNRSLLFRDPDGNLVNFFTPAPRPPSRSSLPDDSAATRQAPPGGSPGIPAIPGAPAERDGHIQCPVGNVADTITPGLLHADSFHRPASTPIARDRGTRPATHPAPGSCAK